MLDIKSIFLKQKMMRKVLLSLIPVVLYAIYAFGLRVLLLMGVVLLCGIIAEYIIMRSISKEKVKISEAVLVSGVLFTLTLPVTTPFWVAAVGIIFGVVFGKGVFGGFGKNIFNPAIVGRCFIYISFPSVMTVSWIKPFMEFPGGFTRFLNSTDALTSATPLLLYGKTGELTSILELMFGRVAGSLGETFAVLIILCGIYLIVTKTASWKLMVSTLASFTLLNTILYLTGVTTADPIFSLMSGGFIFGMVFMVTDPISAPKDDISRIIYGILIGLVTVLIRIFGLFAEGMMFAILVGNMFAPLIERNVRELKNKKVSA